MAPGALAQICDRALTENEGDTQPAYSYTQFTAPLDVNSLYM